MYCVLCCVLCVVCCVFYSDSGVTAPRGSDSVMILALPLPLPLPLFPSPFLCSLSESALDSPVLPLKHCLRGLPAWLELQVLQVGCAVFFTSKLVWCGVVWCGVLQVWCGVVYCGVLWCVVVCSFRYTSKVFRFCAPLLTVLCDSV